MTTIDGNPPMSLPEKCPECGGECAAGICPRCLIRLGLDGPGLSLSRSSGPGVAVRLGEEETRAGVLATLAQTIGPVPRVLLRDTAAVDESEPVVRANSPEMPGPVDRVGRLQLFGEIARGGMGAVLKGRDNDLGRDLAVKVLLERHGDDPGLLRRFVEEAQIAGQLQHPGIVPVYELGAFADRRPYFAMKLVKGQTLAEVMAERREATGDHPRLLAIFLDVAQTVAYAHARGVIHRDLKPSNIMVGSFGEVQVMDWGLAKVLSRGGVVDDREAGKLDIHEPVIAAARSGPGSDVDRSQSGSVLGTPSYMAPEQARGENDGLDERADVFALGSILCEILTGHPAFTGRTTGEILLRAARGDLAAVGERLDGCGADAELVTLARDSLAAEVDSRPAHAGAIVDRLNSHFSGVQVRLRAAELAHAAETARAEEVVSRTRAEGRALRMTVALAASVLVFLGLGGGGYLWIQGQKAERSARIGRSIDDALADAAKLRSEARSTPPGEVPRWGEALAAARRASELAGQGDVADSLRRRIAETTAGISNERDAAESGARQVRVDRVLLARLETIRGDRSQHLDPKRTDADYAAAFRAAGVDFDATSPGDSGRWIAGRSDPAEIVAFVDDWVFTRKKANAPEASWRGLVEAANAADGDPWRNALRALISTPSEEDSDELRRLADDVKAQDDQPAASLVLLAQRLREDLGDRDRSIQVLRRGAIRHPGDFWTHLYLAQYFNRHANPAKEGSAWDVFPNAEESIRHLTAAVAIRPASGIAYDHLGYALLAQKKPEEALAVYREAIRIQPDYLPSYRGLGFVLNPAGEGEAVAAALRKVVASDPGNDDAHKYLGEALLALGQWEGGVAEFREAARLKPAASLHEKIGDLLREHGDSAGAIAAYRESTRIDPDRPDGHRGLVKALASEEPPVDAIVECCELARCSPDPREARDAVKAALATREEGRAIAALREVIRLKPHVALLHACLADQLARIDDPGGAIDELREAIRLEPGRSSNYHDLGDLLCVQGKLAEAIAKYGEGLGREPIDQGIYLGLNQALVAAGPSEKVAAIREAVRLKPDLDRNAKGILAGILLQQGMSDESFAMSRWLLRPEPDHPMYHFQLGLLLKHQGRMDEAIGELRETVRLDGEKLGQGIVDLGDILRDLGRDEEAVATYRRARELAGGNTRSVIELDQRLAGMERRQRLLGRLEAVLQGKERPRDEADSLALINLSVDKRRFAAAARLSAVAFAADPELAEDLDVSLRHKAARCALQAGLGLGNDDPEPDADARSGLRRQSLDWLKADLALRVLAIRSGTPDGAREARKAFAHWEVDAELDGARQAKALAKLPEAERAEWQAFWAEVHTRLAEAGGEKPES